MTASVANQRWWITVAMVVTGLMVMATGCASMNKEACLSADWRTIGYEDGARGRKPSHIGNHRQACAEYGVTPDFELYRQGHAQGLAEWCAPANGYRIGRSGGGYNGGCPSESEPRFVQALEAGRQMFVMQREVNSQARGLDRLNRTLAELKQDHLQAEEDLVRPGIGARRRRQLLSQVRALEADREALLADIASQEQALATITSQMEQARVSAPY